MSSSPNQCSDSPGSAVAFNCADRFITRLDYPFFHKYKQSFIIYLANSLPISVVFCYDTFMIIHSLYNQTTTSHLLGFTTTAENLGLSEPFIYLDKSFTKRYYLINKQNISWYKDAQGTCVHFVTDFP